MAIHDKLCPVDMPHLGALCRRIREGHGVTLQTMARQCGVSHTTISRFEEERGSTSESTFTAYVQALRSKDVVHPPHQPLEHKHVELLRSLYTLYDPHRKDSLQQNRCALAKISFQHIIPPVCRNTELARLVQELEQEQRPAIIMDDLWFIHAMNGKLLRLFGITPEAELLSYWEGWHGIGIKCRQNSLVRQAHVDTNEFFPATNAYFFEDDRTYPHLFTPQMRHLVCRLYHFSEEENFEFHRWWQQVTSFTLPFLAGTFPRTIWYRGQELKVFPSIAKTQTVLIDRYPIQYTLGVWDAGKSTAAQEAFAEVSQIPKQWNHASDYHDVLYAADYDVHHDFHVNAWPEVRSEIEMLECG